MGSLEPPIPPHQKRSVDIRTLPGALPATVIPDGVDPAEISNNLINQMSSLSDGDLTDDALWRDSYGLCGTMRTFYSKEGVLRNWHTRVEYHNAHSFKLIKGSAHVMRFDNTGWITAGFTYETDTEPATTGSGFLDIVYGEDGKYRIWIIRTILYSLKGLGDVDHLDAGGNTTAATNGVQNGDAQNEEFDVAIVGGGQCGLSVGGRLQALGIKYVIFEKNEDNGDSWRKRYDSLRLHTIKDFAHMPFERTFGPDNEVFLGKDAVADGLKQWAEKYRIKVWLSTNLKAGRWNNESRDWTLQVERRGDPVNVKAKHVIFATGVQTPSMPSLPGRDSFQGEVLHSLDYKNAKSWAGKAGVVIGSANTGHDVVDDMYKAGLKEVTMVQKSRTYVLPEPPHSAFHRTIFNDHTPIKLGDELLLSHPASVSRLLAKKNFDAYARSVPEKWDALERAGFRAEPYGDLIHTLNVRLGGHYLDVGTSAKIEKGFIKVKSGAVPVRYTPNGLSFDDGSELPADVIVWTTGFVNNLRSHIRTMFGDEVFQKTEDFYGLNEEGELLGAFKLMEQPRLWFFGFAFAQARHYSRYVAMSIKADLVGKPLSIYKET